MPELLGALDAFLQEHRCCGELAGGVDGERVWMARDCGASVAHPVGGPFSGRLPGSSHPESTRGRRTKLHERGGRSSAAVDSTADTRWRPPKGTLPDDMYGPGTGGICVACEQSILNGDIEVECDLPQGGTIRLHRTCYDIWTAEWPTCDGG